MLAIRNDKQYVFLWRRLKRRWDIWFKGQLLKGQLVSKTIFCPPLSYSILQLFNCHWHWQQAPQNKQDEDFLKFFIHLTLKILLPTEIFLKEQQIMDWQFANITHSTCGVWRNPLSSRHKIGEAIFIECLFKCKTRIDKCTNAGTRLCSLLSSPTSWLTDRLPTRFPPRILFRRFSVFCFGGFACFAAHIANKTYETSTQHHISDEMLRPKET